MKDLELKKRFMAQYFEQVVMLFPDNPTFFKNDCNTTCYLGLKCLIDITDEHALEIAKIKYDEREHTLVSMIEGGKEIAREIHTDKLKEETGALIEIIDTLRLREYAVPYFGMSVYDLEEKGWLVL